MESGTAVPDALMVCGRGHTVGSAPSSVRSGVVTAGEPGSDGAAKAAGVPVESSPPSTATATAVACFLCLSRMPYSLAPTDGLRAHHPTREGVNVCGRCAVFARCGGWGEASAANDGPQQRWRRMAEYGGQLAGNWPLGNGM